jgi:hypothetical protein
MDYRFLLHALVLVVATAPCLPQARAADGVPERASEVAVESSGHLDQLFRKRGFEAYERGRHDEARRHFEYAASYADKTSQFVLGLMHRDGVGVPRDPATAYAWLDLAAERGYPTFLAEREAVWNSLDARGRERAIEVATALYERYGDAVAKARHAAEIRRYLRRSIAGHPSLKGGHIVTLDRTCGGVTRMLRGGGCRVDDYFTEERFDPRTYWATQDDLYMPRGKVVVEPLQKLPASRARVYR